MEESSRDSYQKLGDPGEEENNNTEKKCNKKCIFIIVGVLGLVVAGVVVAIILLWNRGITCSDGQYLPSDDDSKCYDCSANCKQCTGTKSESKCTACKDGYTLDDDICVDFSFKGEYTTTTEHQKIQLINDNYTDNIEKMTIDGNQTDPVSSYEFNTTGNHKVYFKLKSDKIDNLSYLFSSLSGLNAVVFNKDFDSTNVNNIEAMFYSSNSLTSVDLGHFTTTNVMDMNDLFSSCNELNYVDITNFSTNMSNVTLFEGKYPENGTIILSSDFYEKIKDEIPPNWVVVNKTDIDIYDLLEN